MRDLLLLLVLVNIGGKDKALVVVLHALRVMIVEGSICIIWLPELRTTRS
jgi:hypothetical protein